MRTRTRPPADPERWLDEHGDEIDETDRGLPGPRMGASSA